MTCLSEEYEVFKLLKCPSDLHKFYTSTNNAINSINDTKWQNRIKFPEQLVECQGKTIYIVETLERNLSTISRSYEDVHVELYSVPKMTIFKGKPGILDTGLREEATFEELSTIQSADWDKNFLITTESEDRRATFQLYFLNLLPLNGANSGDIYDAVFTDLDTARLYAKHLQEYKRSINGLALS